MATERKRAKYPRVYPKHGAWYWVEPASGKWIRLCSLEDSETKLVERLAAERKRVERPEGTGDMRPLIDEYVKTHKANHREENWPNYGRYAGNGFRNANVADIKAVHIQKWLKKKYPGKLHMQRTMKAFLSGFFQWCIEEERVDSNPCRDVKTDKPKARMVYIPDHDFARIREAMLWTSYDRNGQTVTAKTPTGPMMQCFVDLCYLTAQRSTEIRELTWAQVDYEAGVIHFVPTKTEDSSGAAVDWPITSEIAAVLDRVREIDGVVKRIGTLTVIHALDGKKYANAAMREAWNGACRRAGLGDAPYTVKDIRAKAATDAKKAGYNIDEIMAGLAHTDTKTTEIYLKQREVPLSNLRLKVPSLKSG